MKTYKSRPSSDNNFNPGDINNWKEFLLNSFNLKEYVTQN